MVSISFFILFAILEAFFMWLFLTWCTPNKENKEKLKEFAEEHNVSLSTATDHIFAIFFEAYESGLREKMRAAHEESIRQDFERWRKEREAELNTPKPKQIVKPIKKSRNR